MIRVNLDIALAKRRLSVQDFAAAVGITPANISVLKNGRAKAIRFTTLDAMCKVLECQPGEILEFVEEATPAPSSTARQMIITD